MRTAANYNTFVDADSKTKQYEKKSALEQAKMKESYRLNKYKVPPDFEQSRKHRIATRASKPIFVKKNGEKSEIDPASGLPVENEEFNLCCPAMELSELSPAAPMYFEFVKSSVYLLTILLLVSGVFNFTTNWIGDYCIDSATATADQIKSATVCISSFATRSSIANTNDEEGNTTEKIQDWLNLGGFFAMVLYLNWFRYRQRKTAVLCDQQDWTAADFTLLVRGIPKIENKEIDDEVKSYFEKHGLPDGRKLDVKRVILCYDVREIYANEKRILDFVHQIKSLHQKSLENGDPSLVSQIGVLQGQIANLEEENLKLSRAYFEGTAANFVGTAFVTVNTLREANEVADYWSSPNIYKRFFGKKVLKERFYGEKLHVYPAPEPSDVYWENLGISKKEKTIRSILTLTTLILILAGVWCFIYYLTYYQDQKVVEWNQNTTTESSWKMYALTYCISFAVQGANYLLIYVITYTSGQEKHTTWTTRKMSQATKLAWTQFLITSVIELTIAIKLANYWGYNGLITSVFEIFELNAVTPALVLMMSPLYWMGWVFMKLQTKKKEKANITQIESDTLHEMPEFELSAKYAVILKNMFSAAFYAPVLPAVLILTIIGNILIYWADKHVLVKKSSVGKALGARLAQEMTENMEWVLVVYAVSNVLFNQLFYAEVTIPGYIAIILSIINALLPMEEINRIIAPPVKEKITEDTFDKRRLEFEEDYDRQNPATRAYSLAKFEAESRGEVFDKKAPSTISLQKFGNLGLGLKF